MCLCGHDDVFVLHWSSFHARSPGGECCNFRKDRLVPRDEVRAFGRDATCGLEVPFWVPLYACEVLSWF